MNFKLDFFNKMEIGILIFLKNGEIKYINTYGEKYFPPDQINIFEIFSHVENKKLSQKSFTSLSKVYNNLFIMLFKQPESNVFMMLFKEKEFFKAFFNQRYKDDSILSDEHKYCFKNIIGNSPEIKKVIKEAKKIADQKSNILLTGESGTGKEFFARSIHYSSSRKDYPFIAVNCGAIPKDLIESELFGYEPGTFTGANKQGHIGKFELANGGTIFLDEIGEMPLAMQISLLRVLQDKCVTKIGGKKCNKIDVRIIAATNKDLKAAIKENKFRKDLYYRLNAFNIKIPALKNRLGDIPIFLDYLLKEKSIELNKPIPKMSEQLFKKAISYCWPGNIRELENFVENFVVLDGISTYDINFDECHCMTHDNLGNKLNLDKNGKYILNDIESAYESNNIIGKNIVIDSSKNNAFTEHEDEHYEKEMKIYPIIELEIREIKKALKIFEGNVTKSAAALGISRNALYQKIKKYNIEK